MSETKNSERPCILCRTPIPGAMGADARFCCAGCEKVYDVLGRLDAASCPAYVEAARRLGLIPEGKSPAGSPTTPDRDDLPETVEGFRRERLEMTGLMCPSCGWVAEQVLTAADGVGEARVDYFSATCEVRYDLTRISRDDLADLLKPLGYGLSSLSDNEKGHISRRSTHRFLVVAILAMNVMSLSFLRYFQTLGVLDHLPRFIPWLEALLVLPILTLGWLPILRRAGASLRHRRMTMDLLIAIGVGAAAILSAVSLVTGREDMYFETCAGLVTISLLSQMIESRLRERAFSALAPLMRMRVVHARVADAEGEARFVDIGTVRSGDRVIFEQGEIVPFDGVVENDRAVVSEAVLTGEPVPVAKVRGDAVAAGSTVVEGRLRLTVRRLFEETLLARIAASVGETLSRQEQRMRQSDRIASRFIPVVVAIALGAWFTRMAMYGMPFALTPDGWFPSISVLAVACPCAFSLAGISAVTAVVGGLLRKGFLVKELEQLDTLAATDHVIFDKTGTVTRGAMTVTRIAWAGAPDQDLLRQVRRAEQSSGHPVAEAIRARLSNQETEETDTDEPVIRELPGSGRIVELGGRTLTIGNASLFDDPFLPEETGSHQTAVWFGYDRRAAGCFLLTDEIRPSAEAAVRGLSELGISTELVSGDRAAVTERVAAAVGIPSARGDASIEDKVAAVRSHLAAGRTVAFVGDGTNDAIAMSESHVSIALARSTDEALSASGLVAVHGDLEHLHDVFRAGRRLAAVVKQNYLWAFGFNTLFIPVAAMGELVPLAAMGLMFLSSVTVLLNSLRLR